MSHIWHLVHQFPPEALGGTELYTQSLARWQAQQGHRVAILTPSPAALPSSREAGVEVVRLPIGQRRPAARFLHTFYHPALAEAVARHWRAQPPDLVHIQHLMGWPLAVVEQLRATGAPYVITLHDYWFICANAQLLTNYDQSVCAGPEPGWGNCGRCLLAWAGLPAVTWLGRPAAPLLRERQRRLQTVLAGAAAVVAPTHFVRQQYEAHGLASGRMHVIPHGLAVEADILAQVRAQAPSHTDFHIGYVGSLGWQKGVHHLIEAVNQLPPDGVRLTVVGQLDVFPDYGRQLQAAARHPGIRFVGALPHDQVWAFLATLDVGVLPTLWYEVSPLILDEFLAMRVPVVASRLGAMAEKITHEGNGLLTPPGDSVALAETLERLRRDPALRARLSAGAPPIMTIHDHARQIEQLYQASLSAPL